MFEVMTDGLGLSLIISGALLLLGLKYRSLPVVMISSLGWMISGLQVYQQTTEALPMLLLIALAAMQFFLVTRRD